MAYKLYNQKNPFQKDLIKGPGNMLRYQETARGKIQGMAESLSPGIALKDRQRYKEDPDAFKKRMGENQ